MKYLIVLVVLTITSLAFASSTVCAHQVGSTVEDCVWPPGHDEFSIGGVVQIDNGMPNSVVVGAWYKDWSGCRYERVVDQYIMNPNSSWQHLSFPTGGYSLIEYEWCPAGLVPAMACIQGSLEAYCR